jgi:bla regulator protein BlaR1
MIPQSSLAMWAAIAPALANHIWQSTLFALMAGLLTLILQKNHARTRYWLWLAASAKFLVPFSLLFRIGSYLSWSRRSAGTKPGLYFAMEKFGQAFTQPTLSMISRAAHSMVYSSLMRLLPGLLATVWLCGFAVVIFLWYLRWRAVSAAMRESAPLREGREVEALRRLERMGGVQKRIELVVTRASLEPGIFGIAQPVLIWPEGISERLEDANLEAVLAHEVWHVRRRDNLTAVIHMLVEAIFWFYPVVWWLGARLLEERERACDEEVLELGTDRHVYAASILKVCEFCVELPLACVSGVTGADLKKRMVAIMNENVVRELDFGRKLLLSTAGLLAIVVPITLGLTNATSSRAELQGENTAAKGRQTEHHPTRVSKDVMSGLIRKKVPPEYPEKARKEHIQGTVDLQATIGKEGDVENLQVISGHPMLVAASIEAVKLWKYKPYLLNGEPVEVETQVDVIFTLNP